MGDAKRRRAGVEGPVSIEAVTAAFDEMHAEGQGVWQFTLITPDVVMALTVQALMGDTTAARTLLASETFILKLRKVRPRMLCLFCENQFRSDSMPAVLIMLHAGRDDATNAIFQGVCSQCEANGDLESRLIARYREWGFTDLRPISIGEPGLA